MTAAPSGLGRPVGAVVPRRRALRPVAGRGCYTDDVTRPRMAHAAFVRSPHAHAEIEEIDVAEAAAAPGVVAVFTGEDLAATCRPWTARHAAYPGLATRPQHPLARGRATWQGEPVVAVVAATRALAEDAAECVRVAWRELPAAVDPLRDAAPDGPAAHPDMDGSLALEVAVVAGDPRAAAAGAAHVVEETFRFARHTGVCLEARSIVAEFDPSDGTLTVHQSHQAPHNLQDCYSALLGIPEHRVRVVCPDVGGGFGLKQQLYADETAVCAMTMLLGRPLKFVADRLESFVSDIHARDHLITARMAMDADGGILAMEVDDLFAIGPYSSYPRSSVGEGALTLRMCGAPYRVPDYAARLRVVLQNKNLVGHYRGVGHPIAVAVTEGLLERAAREAGLDPLAVRRRNLVGPADLPYNSAGGLVIEETALPECLDEMERVLDLPALRAEQAALRERGIYRGLGLAANLEITVPGPEYYGRAEARITAADACVARLEPSGTVRVLSSVTEQGQGGEDCVRQVVAAALGVAVDDVDVTTGDTGTAPYGAGAWASRCAAIGGEAAYRAARDLRARILEVAGAVLQAAPGALDLTGGVVVDVAGGGERMPLAEVARIAHFRQDLLPPDLQPQMVTSATYVPRDRPARLASGVQASWLEVDPETGWVRLLRHVVVHECGRIVNPLVVEEQIRGGVTQGLGSALFEECVYDEAGQLLNGSLADYLVPMAAEMPDIEVHHISPDLAADRLDAKGAGEAGTSGAQAAVQNALNDALAPLGARVSEQPATPAAILGALGRIGAA